MKFDIETKALDGALKIAAAAVLTGRSTLPILGNVKIEATGAGIILSTTNLENYIQQKLPAKIERTGATTAPFSILSRLVSRMQSSSISIEQKEKVIEFRSGEVTAELETLEAAEFPGPLEKAGDGVECDALEVLTPFQMVAHAISDEHSRYALMGVNVNAHGEFTATDGRRVATYAGVKLTADDVILSNIFVQAILKIEPAGPIKIFIGKGNVTLESHDVNICAKLIEAQFPAGPRSVIGDFKSEKAFSAGRKELIHALQTCSIFSAHKNPGLTLTGKGKQLEVSQPGKASASVMGTELNGQPKISIKLDERFLIGVLSVLKEEDVRIRVTDENSPVMIEEGKFKEIVMPMRTPK